MSTHAHDWEAMPLSRGLYTCDCGVTGRRQDGVVHELDTPPRFEPERAYVRRFEPVVDDPHDDHRASFTPVPTRFLEPRGL